MTPTPINKVATALHAHLLFFYTMVAPEKQQFDHMEIAKKNHSSLNTDHMGPNLFEWKLSENVINATQIKVEVTRIYFLTPYREFESS